MSVWSEWLDRLHAILEDLRHPRPTGMPAPDRCPPEPYDPPLGPDIVVLASTLDWQTQALQAALRGEDWPEAPASFVALCGRAEHSERFRGACHEYRCSPSQLLLGALHTVALGRVPDAWKGQAISRRPERLFAALGLSWADFARPKEVAEAGPSPGTLLLALAPTLDWSDPELRRGLVDEVWTPPPMLRELVSQTRKRADATPLYEIGVAMPAHTVVLSCLALLRSLDDYAIGDLPCPAAGGSVRDFPDPVQTAMFLLLDLKWPPVTPGAPVGLG
ncbi:hypothetical protein [Xanthobacter aminoxidans]|uniref:hypothetical protein n=1 Tax=Xanthobacter aminoxidans TaxID=186280 RepID=UPI002022FA4C|nr:hypothetical protein [Xanthobacter aminoxidans]MCL8385791.1 hypothetical protein [Xanthobacter aminoxidans]